jgi:hypothetical protein
VLCYTRTVLVKVNWSIIRAVDDGKDATEGKVLRTLTFRLKDKAIAIHQISNYMLPSAQRPCP